MTHASRPDLAAILRAHGAAYLAAHPALSGTQTKAWRAILACRTAALGGHVTQCDACGERRHVYHSCRNRHCPQCQTRAKEAWITARSRELLPVPYFHLVFTVPHALNGWAAHAPRRLYELLFRAVAETLLEFAADPRHLGGTPAFTLVLHTWTQQLARHPHLHALMAGGALTGAGDWVSPRRGFLFPVKALSKVFRGKFVAALREEHCRERRTDQRAETKLDEVQWQALLAALYRHDWVVYAKQPLGAGGEHGEPAQVLDYLARYTHKTAISNHRITGLADETVSFRVRDPQHPKSGRTTSLPATEFIGRFLTHVLPPGFKRIRHYGLLASRYKAVKLAACRALLNVPAPVPAVIESVADFMLRVAQVDLSRCSHCASGRLRFVAALAAVRVPLVGVPPVRASPVSCFATGPPR